MSNGLLKIYIKSNKALGDLVLAENKHIVDSLSKDRNVKVPAVGVYIADSITMINAYDRVNFYYVICIKMSVAATATHMIYASTDEVAARHMLNMLAQAAFTTGNYTMD